MLSPVLTLELPQASLQREKFIRKLSCLSLNHVRDGFPNPELLPWVPENVTDTTTCHLALLAFLPGSVTIIKQA